LELALSILLDGLLDSLQPPIETFEELPVDRSEIRQEPDDHEKEPGSHEERGEDDGLDVTRPVAPEVEEQKTEADQQSRQ
jgi:hypothetical protein